jgi:hypothetical protein
VTVAGALVLDEQVTAVQAGLLQRGIDCRTVHELGVTSTVDPDVIRGIASVLHGRPWVLVTMDGTIVEEHAGFEWHLYAIAWVSIDPWLSGASVEQAKTDVIHRHAHQMLEQRPGDHHTYTVRARFRHPPGLMSRQRKR